MRTETKSLRGCPFCKGKAGAMKAHQDNDGTWHPAACGCPNCHVYFYGDDSYGHNGFADPEDYEKSLMQAIARWNTRYERTCKVNIGKTVTGKGQTYVATCDSCGHLIGECCDYGHPAIPNHCQNCGAKVVEVVSE